MATSPTVNGSGPGGGQVRVFVRLNRHERAQHVIFFVAFLLLAVTGFTLRLPEEWMRRLGSIGMGYEVRSLIHRSAGIVMILISLAHIFYILFLREGRQWLRDIFMWPHDLVEGLQNVMYYVGLREKPPKFGRFNYKEKMEYWALFAGNTLMSVSGLMLMFEFLWPQLALDIASLIHRMEAILACLAIIVWHMYEVHLRPGKFPHSLVWFLGWMDEEEMAEEHPAHLEELIEKGGPRVIHIHESEAKDDGGMLGRVFWFLGYPMALLFTLIALWLLYLLYFDDSWQDSMMKSHTRHEGTATSQEVIDARRSQFHIQIPYSLDSIVDPPVCVACHTPYPHQENVRLRAYLNAHGTHMDCTTCHYRPEEGEDLVYRWINDATDEIVGSVQGSRGVYGARVYPCRIGDDGQLHRLGKRISEPEWGALAERAAGLGLEQRRAIADPAHDELQGDPLSCSECHSPNGVLDLEELGHSESMVQRLTDLEVVRMLEDTAEFHFPDIRGTMNR